MEEGIKNRIIFILVILTAIFFIGALASCNDAHRQRSGRGKEMLTRLDLEEKNNKLMQDKAKLEERVDSLAKEFDTEKDAHQATNKALLQEQMINESLKEELQKINKLKEALEENLKEALVTQKSKR